MPGDLEVLEHGEIKLLGQLANSSNETFLVELTYDDDQVWAIYKPELGERPLRDFPPGLFRRERAAYLLSEYLGWGIVPATVVRDDGPFGTGSLQRFVNHDPNEHAFTLLPAEPAPAGVSAIHDQLRRIALFDLIANNADRKAGHVLRGDNDHLWAIDHGLCFAAAPKLRTVLWEFTGETIDAGLLAALEALAAAVPEDIAGNLTWFEEAALVERVQEVLTCPQFPEDLTGMAFPWPPV